MVPFYERKRIGPRGDTYRFQPNQDGTQSEWTKTAGGGGGTLVEFPFQITAGSSTFTVRYGTVEDIAPLNVGTTLFPTNNATNTVYINCDVAGGNVTAAAINLTTGSLPSDNPSSGKAYKLVGQVVVASGLITAVNQSLMFSQGFAECTNAGTSVYHFYVD